MTDVSKSFDGFWTRLQLYGRSNIPFEYLKGYKPELEDTQEFAIKYSRGGDTYQFVQLRDKDKHKAGVELADIDVGPKFDEHMDVMVNTRRKDGRCIDIEIICYESYKAVNGFYSMRTGSTCTLRWTRKVY
jgi:hypothetical protein